MRRMQSCLSARNALLEWMEGTERIRVVWAGECCGASYDPWTGQATAAMKYFVLVSTLFVKSSVY